MGLILDYSIALNEIIYVISSLLVGGFPMYVYVHYSLDDISILSLRMFLWSFISFFTTEGLSLVIVVSLIYSDKQTCM